jgi:hypothetical protein
MALAGQLPLVMFVTSGLKQTGHHKPSLNATENGDRMNIADLITKLVEIERAIGKADSSKLREMVIDCEEEVLRVERQMIDTLGENGRLRERMENCDRSSLFRLSSPRITEGEADLMELSGPLARKQLRDDGRSTIN